MSSIALKSRVPTATFEKKWLRLIFQWLASIQGKLHLKLPGEILLQSERVTSFRFKRHLVLVRVHSNVERAHTVAVTVEDVA